MNKIILISLVLSMLIIGCNNSNENTSKDITSSSSEENLENTNIASQEEIILGAVETFMIKELLETPIRIIDNIEDLNQLYSDLNRTTDVITTDFISDKVVYIQRDTNIGIELIKEENGIRINSTGVEYYNNENYLYGAIIVIKNIYNTRLYFTKTSTKHRICDAAYTFNLENNVTKKIDINKSVLFGQFNVNSDTSLFSQTFFEGATVSLEDAFERYGINDVLPELNASANQIVSSGFYINNATTKYNNAILQQIFKTETYTCVLGPLDAATYVNTNVVFDIDAVRSDCAEFDTSINEKKVSFYSIPGSLDDRQFAQNIQILHVKSCTGYLSTPKINEVLWYQEREISDEVLP